MKRFFAKLFSQPRSAAPHAARREQSRPVDPTVRAAYGFPPRIDDFFGEAEPADEHGWTYSLWVEEWAESYLGSDEFTSLERRFASVPGIERVAHIDREVFLIQTSLGAEQVRQFLWPQFIDAAIGGRNVS